MQISQEQLTQIKNISTRLKDAAKTGDSHYVYEAGEDLQSILDQIMTVPVVEHSFGQSRPAPKPEPKKKKGF
jgi:hypothetical protein